MFDSDRKSLASFTCPCAVEHWSISQFCFRYASETVAEYLLHLVHICVTLTESPCLLLHVRVQRLHLIRIYSSAYEFALVQSRRKTQACLNNIVSVYPPQLAESASGATLYAKSAQGCLSLFVLAWCETAFAGRFLEVFAMHVLLSRT